ncbi:hypothetical protein [Psychrobacillus vulpis]|uniref:Uncharacterized protein n=1 Tax=Psychrobacillus vulpis TaxID=2325572 RepID=A0A544TU31_9BACI|nr:hypothetical protein [Psychrobacillus vulpis]TQR20944.1 hypothetical protein FG384_04945 [Psychrobacillus vulpis]
MVGTILSNFWAALFAFSIYFFSTYPFINAVNILFNASVIAIIVFFVTFIIRAIIAFVMETPVVSREIIGSSNVVGHSQTPSSEEMAKVIKSMLNEDE